MFSRRFSTIIESLHKNLPDKLYRTIEIEAKGHDPAVLRSYMRFAQMATNHLNIRAETWSQKRYNFERFTVLKSAFVHKKHRVQYEIRTYFKYLKMDYLTGSTADTILEYLQRNLPEGVALKTTKVEMVPFPDFIQPKAKDSATITPTAQLEQSAQPASSSSSETN